MNELVLNQTGSKGTSDSYRVITTEQVLNRFETKGYNLTHFSKARSKQYEGYQKHLIRVSHPDFAGLLKDARPEIVIVNSYNGSTALSMFLGAYRFVCANGLMVGTGFGGASVRHVGNNIDGKIDSGIEQLVAQLPKLIEDVNSMQIKQVSRVVQDEYLKRATELVLPENASVLPMQDYSCYVSRQDDSTSNAYATFNVVQELALKRGLYYLNEKNKSARTRQVKSITRQVSLNRDLWDLAQEILVA